MIDSALISTIETTVRDYLAPLAVSRVDVEEGEDYDSNDVLFVTVNLPRMTAQIPGEQYLDVMTAVSNALLKIGDERIPYLRTFRDGEAVPDEELDRAS